MSMSSTPAFHHKSSLKDEACLISSDSAQTVEPGSYRLQNFYDAERCGPLHRATDLALTLPLMQFRDGYGYAGRGGCAIQADSALRLGSVITNTRAPQQLCARLHLSVPYMGRGLGDPCTESSIQEGVDTSSKRQCNTLAGIHLPHQYTPLVPCLEQEIQNPKHIVPEANRSDWVRGGYPSRQWVRNVKYCSRCGQTNFCTCHHAKTVPRSQSRPTSGV
jgi:hypothetical protein